MLRGALVAIALLWAPLVLASEPVSGPLYLQDTLVIPAGETLTILPGTKVTSPSNCLPCHIEVFGSLQSLGNASRPIEITVPILLAGNGSSAIQNTRLWGVSGTALTVRSGNLTLANVTFEGNGVGLAVLAAGDAHIVADSVTFRAHASEGARIQGAAAVELSRANFSDNLRGLVLDLSLDAPVTARVNDSTFERNGAHVDVALGSAPAPADVRFVNDDFGATTSPAGVARPGVLVHSDLPRTAIAAVPSAAPRNLTSIANSYHDADVAARLDGAGYRFTSQGDRFFANRIALSVSDASAARVIGSTFDSREKDIDAAAPANVLTEGATFSAAVSVTGAALAPATSGGATSWWLPAGGAALVALAATGGAVAVRVAQRQRSARAAAPAPPAALPPDLAAPLRPMERRVLEDILAHPGTAQAAVAQRLGLTRQALHYHVKKLEARRLVAKTTRGRETQCTVPDDVARALALSPRPAEDQNASADVL